MISTEAPHEAFFAPISHTNEPQNTIKVQLKQDPYQKTRSFIALLRGFLCSPYIRSDRRRSDRVLNFSSVRHGTVRALEILDTTRRVFEIWEGISGAVDART